MLVGISALVNLERFANLELAANLSPLASLDLFVGPALFANQSVGSLVVRQPGAVCQLRPLADLELFAATVSRGKSGIPASTCPLVSDRPAPGIGHQLTEPWLAKHPSPRTEFAL